jgi:G:T/U-mismatch repair DNA glycosylase
MINIKHKFLDHKIDLAVETLIIGTFNPDTKKNKATFFYGRGRNYLWRILPIAYNESDLKKAEKEEKIRFIKKHKVDFIDLIAEVEVEDEQVKNYYDRYLDKRENILWREILPEIKKLKSLKRVCFTRKTISDIPNMLRRIEIIEDYCKEHRISFKALSTPARYYRDDKQTEWTNFLLDVQG